MRAESALLHFCNTIDYFHLHVLLHSAEMTHTADSINPCYPLKQADLLRRKSIRQSCYHAMARVRASGQTASTVRSYLMSAR